MQIHEKPALGRTPTTGDKLVIDTGTNTYNIDYNALATAIIGKLGGDPVTFAHGGNGKTSKEAALAELFSGHTTTGITTYPTKPGLYRVAGATVTGLPAGATKYGLLRIESACPESTYAYASHVYTDSNNGVYMGYTSDTFGAPSNWVNITGIIPITRGGSGQSTEAGMRGAVFNNSATSGITTYPTTPGLYRVTASCVGLPSNATYYGILAIFGAGSYYMHIFASSDNNLYYAYKGSSGAPTKWYKVTGTATNPVS